MLRQVLKENLERTGNKNCIWSKGDPAKWTNGTAVGGGTPCGACEKLKARAVHSLSSSKYPVSEIDFHSADIWVPILCELGATKNAKITKTIALCMKWNV